MRRGATAMASSTARSQLMTPGATRCVITSASDVSSPIMPKGATLELAVLLEVDVRGVVGNDGVHGAVHDALDERGCVLGRAQRRVHLERGVVVVT